MRKKEFLENRISWQWFGRKFDQREDRSDVKISDETGLLLEILKELQYLNDQKT